MTLTTCSTKGRRGSHAAERAFHCRRASDLRATRRLAPCCSKTERPGVSLPPSLALALPGAFPLRACSLCCRAAARHGHGRHCQLPTTALPLCCAMPCCSLHPPLPSPFPPHAKRPGRRCCMLRSPPPLQPPPARGQATVGHLGPSRGLQRVRAGPGTLPATSPPPATTMATGATSRPATPCCRPEEEEDGPRA